jgi:hypothetical protein
VRTEPGHRDNYFKPDQRGWYEPCERDVNGQPIDEVVDWVAMEYKLLRQEKVVATMMVLSAESIKSGKRSPDYWQAEGPWMPGTALRRSGDRRAGGSPGCRRLEV